MSKSILTKYNSGGKNAWDQKWSLGTPTLEGRALEKKTTSLLPERNFASFMQEQYQVLESEILDWLLALPLKTNVFALVW